MDEEEDVVFDELLSWLVDCFPQITDIELLTEAILQSDCNLELAIDYVLAHGLSSQQGAIVLGRWLRN